MVHIIRTSISTCTVSCRSTPLGSPSAASMHCGNAACGPFVCLFYSVKALALFPAQLAVPQYIGVLDATRFKLPRKWHHQPPPFAQFFTDHRYIPAQFSTRGIYLELQTQRHS
ncbi:hypothetical protein CC86DRAFT_107298 [Ophiobolus disseminans]|uniref:Uncharacterized protein n=1 Tax=Ophiobolus disseminans TaxID=1469910 RepID=A0A6A6ZIZ5_9PLEO|nr:hypothetical protein CC86DRAFT_107298 [Ophiobolus disseminans]